MFNLLTIVLSVLLGVPQPCDPPCQYAPPTFSFAGDHFSELAFQVHPRVEVSEIDASDELTGTLTSSRQLLARVVHAPPLMDACQPQQVYTASPNVTGVDSRRDEPPFGTNLLIDTTVLGTKGVFSGFYRQGGGTDDYLRVPFGVSSPCEFEHGTRIVEESFYVRDTGTITFVPGYQRNVELKLATSFFLQTRYMETCISDYPASTARPINAYINVAVRRGATRVARQTGTAKLVPGTPPVLAGIFTSNQGLESDEITCTEPDYREARQHTLRSPADGVTATHSFLANATQGIFVDVTAYTIDQGTLGRIRLPSPLSLYDRLELVNLIGLNVVDDDDYNPLADMDFDGDVDATDLDLFDQVWCILADVTGDSVVDFGDQLEFGNWFDQLDNGADLDLSGGVDFGDFLLFYSWYSSCGA